MPPQRVMRCCCCCHASALPLTLSIIAAAIDYLRRHCCHDASRHAVITLLILICRFSRQMPAIARKDADMLPLALSDVSLPLRRLLIDAAPLRVDDKMRADAAITSLRED